jgi:hypothetical protein
LETKAKRKLFADVTNASYLESLPLDHIYVPTASKALYDHKAYVICTDEEQNEHINKTETTCNAILEHDYVKAEEANAAKDDTTLFELSEYDTVKMMSVIDANCHMLCTKHKSSILQTDVDVESFSTNGYLKGILSELKERYCTVLFSFLNILFVFLDI